MKYVTKVETASKTFHSVIKAAVDNSAENATPVKVLQSALVKSQTRDFSKQESCLLLSNVHNYTESSMKFKMVSVSGCKKVDLEGVAPQDQAIGDKKNMAEIYWNRLEDDNFKAACASYEEDKEAFIKSLPTTYKDIPHPSDISLHFFVSYFNSKWKPTKNEVVPVISPCFLTIPNKMRNKETFDLFCKCLLFEWKPGCTPQTIGQEFANAEEELRDFVANSPFCPSFVKHDFNQSQKISAVPQQEQNQGEDGEQEDLEMELAGVEGVEEEQKEEEDPTAFPALFNPPVQDDQNDNVLNKELIALHRDAIKAPSDKEIDEASEIEHTHETGAKQKEVDYYYPKFLDLHKDYNWQEAYHAYEFTPEKIKQAHTWLNGNGIESPGVKQTYRLPAVDYSNVDPDQLNKKQRLGYDFVTNWAEEGMATGNFKQLLLHVSGEGGTGKSVVTRALAKYFQENCPPNFCQLLAPTGAAS